MAVQVKAVQCWSSDDLALAILKKHFHQYLYCSLSTSDVEV